MYIIKRMRHIHCGNMKPIKKKILPSKVRIFLIDLTFTAVFTAFILSASIVFVMCFRPMFYLNIRFLQLDKEAGLSAETIRNNYNKLIQYLMLWNRKPLYLPDFQISGSGRIHFADCKKIFDHVQVLFFISGTFLLVQIMKRNLKQLSQKRKKQKSNKKKIRKISVFVKMSFYDRPTADRHTGCDRYICAD